MILPHGQTPGEMPVPSKVFAGRTMAFHALRFASVLIGAGLLLRTASAEYVISAPQQEPERAPGKLSPAPRLALPQPAFGKEAARPHADAPSQARLAIATPAPRRMLAAAPGERRTLLPPVEDSAGLAKPVAPEVLTAVAASAASVPAPAPAATSAPAASAPAIAARRTQPDPGLLAPVRVVSGAPVMRAPPAPSAPVASRPAEAAVQIVLAPPPMRPGPRTTALTSDVRAEMRRPASAWDYAEALPPELTARSAAAPVQQAAPAMAANPAPRTPDLSAAPRIAAEPKAASAPLAAAAAPAAMAPRTLALLDRTPAPQREETLRAAPMRAPSRGVQAPRPSARASAKAVPTRQLLADDRRNRLIGAAPLAPAADQRGSRKDALVTDDAVASMQTVSLQTSGAGPSPILAEDADSNGTSGSPSLRDRMPRPAF